MNVTIYGTPTCSYCNAAREFLTMIGVSFNEVNVMADPIAAQEIVNKTGQRSLPVIDVNGTIIIGFNREALLDSLRTNGFSI